jgi:radical SAM protein with 4Fe4S-binding SPASM domain
VTAAPHDFSALPLAPPPLGARQRLRRRLTPTRLWNTRLESLVLGVESLLRRGTRDFFQVVEVETTTHCNRRCSYCPNSSFDRGLLAHERRMSSSLFERLLRQLADLDFTGRISPHFYGEPLLDERLEALILRCRTVLPLAKVIVFSNGDHLDLARYQRLILAGVDGLLITQHSNKELKGVKRVQEYRKRYGGAGVRFDFRAFDESTQLSNRGGLVEHRELELKADCRIPSENVTIDHQGNVILCCNDYFSSVSFGNIQSEHLGDIWEKADYKQLRRELRRGEFKLEICRRCAAGEAGVVTETTPRQPARRSLTLVD